ncbi:hypothetical protein TBH_C0096 [Thiolapillus brandeum]|uniref:DUF1565 domain-containing protein n=2 Tax=Thiolapillus brandeum TaxID=1076588 RepID=A0A7U6JFK7_9GAMM|nr:hypothetical protein TBH_C0096 [Thiolapillus brandeum]
MAIRLWVLFYLFSVTLVARGAFYYVDATNGSDSNPGNSLDAPWLTLNYAINQLQAGDTLYLRAGTFYESQLIFTQSGTRQNWITIKPWNNEEVIIDGSLADFRATNNDAWELLDDDLHIYRSIDTYDMQRANGYLSENDGHWRLVTYEDFSTFSAANEYYSANPPYYYVGPGLFYNSSENKIYVRLQYSIYQASQNLRLPVDNNPNHIPLYIFDDNEVVLFSDTASYIHFENINLRYQNNAVEIKSGAHHIKFSGGSMIGGRDFVLVRDLAHDIVIENVNFKGYIPPWIARSDVKHPTPGRPAHLMQSSAVNISDGAYDVEVSGCHFDHFFDAIDATKSAHDLFIHDNHFHIVRDDVLQLGSAAYNVEIANNILTEVTAGFSWNGSGAPPVGQMGTVFVHHNVIDTSVFSLYGRMDPNNELDDKNDGPNGDGMATGRAFGMHTKSSITAGAPWKIYHNTVVVSKDVDNRGTGAGYYIDAFNADYPHEVYNNIFWQKWDSYIVRAARTEDGSQIFDGNLYYRSSITHDTAKYYHYYQQVGGSYQNFQNLNDFVGSGYWLATQSYYANGWDSQSVEENPMLDNDYRPETASPAAFGAIDLSSKNWPGLKGETFRGALAPIDNNIIFINGFEN